MTPKVIIPKQVHQKIMHWVNKSNFEVSGLGKLVQKDGVCTVLDVMLLPQKNGTTHTDIEAEEVGKAMFQLKDTEGDLRFWWHSHVDMGVFWSGTDMETIKKIGAGGWFVSTVFNKKREMKSAFYAVAGYSLPWGSAELFLDNLETKVDDEQPADTQAWDAEYDKNVTNQSYVPRNGWNGVNPLWQNGHRVIDLRKDNGKIEYAKTLTSFFQASQNKALPKEDRRALRKVVRDTELHDLEHLTKTGFAAEDIVVFMKAGVSAEDIVKLCKQTLFTNSEIVQMFEAGTDIPDILAMAEQGQKQALDEHIPYQSPYYDEEYSKYRQSYYDGFDY